MLANAGISKVAKRVFIVDLSETRLTLLFFVFSFFPAGTCGHDRNKKRTSFPSARTRAPMNRVTSLFYKQLKSFRTTTWCHFFSRSLDHFSILYGFEIFEYRQNILWGLLRQESSDICFHSFRKSRKILPKVPTIWKLNPKIAGRVVRVLGDALTSLSLRMPIQSVL